MKDLFSTDIQYLKGVGPKRAELYHKLGVDSVGSLLHYYPRDYIDLSSPVALSAAPLDLASPVVGRVVRKLPPVRISGGRMMYKVIATDMTDDFQITFFNSPYPYQQLTEGEDYLFYGKFGGTLTDRQVIAPMILPAGDRHPVLPVYPLTKGLTSKQISASAEVATTQFLEDLADPLPEEIRRQYELCHINYAIENIHFPENVKAATIARRRLIFQELLVLQLGLMSLKSTSKGRTHHQLKEPNFTPFYNALPFPLTGAQMRCVGEIAGDMAGNTPMNRLLQGDVGSGKTAVAAAAIYQCCQAGKQSAMMAPTEILAAQHHKTLEKMLAPLGIRVALLTGGPKTKEKKAVLAALAEGEIDLVIGTHALVQKEVIFRDLALVITDEQHRFGVAQRTTLGEKGQAPHTLVMSATPIPRTLALIIYGDLDISILDEKPAGRQDIKTFWVDYGKFRRAVGFAEKQVQSGHQAYVVCPLIEEGESELKSAEEVAGQMQALLPHRKIEILHGKMSQKKKDETMRAFSDGNIDILVSTTVIEVGVDVPNATLILIHNAERFGLSALHQLRGRVGRSDTESFCVLLSDARGETAKKRLGAMCQTNDGFKLADLDLKLRGPGDFFGNAQHGLPQLKIADLLTDRQTLMETTAVAAQLQKNDPGLRKHPLLKQEVRRLFQRVSAGGLN